MHMHVSGHARVFEWQIMRRVCAETCRVGHSPDLDLASPALKEVLSFLPIQDIYFQSCKNASRNFLFLSLPLCVAFASTVRSPTLYARIIACVCSHAWRGHKQDANSTIALLGTFLQQL